MSRILFICLAVLMAATVLLGVAWRSASDLATAKAQTEVQINALAQSEAQVTALQARVAIVNDALSRSKSQVTFLLNDLNNREEDYWYAFVELRALEAAYARIAPAGQLVTVEQGPTYGTTTILLEGDWLRITNGSRPLFIDLSLREPNLPSAKERSASQPSPIGGQWGRSSASHVPSWGRVVP